MRPDRVNVSRSGLGRADLVHVLSIPDPKLREQALATFAERLEIAPEPLSLEIPIRVPAREGAASQPIAEPAPKPSEKFHWCPVWFSLRDDVEALPPPPRKPDATLRPPRHFSTEFAPLLDASNLLTAIRRATIGWKTTTELDAPAVVDRVSRCTLVDPIPYRKRRSWGPEILVVLDRSLHLAPYSADVEAVLANLASVYPNDGIELAHRHGQDLVRSKSLGADRMPRPGRPVLALTDLGCLAESGNAPTDPFWLRWGRRFRERGNPTLALVPTFPSRVPAPLREVWSVISWGAAGGVTTPDRDEAWARLLRLLSPAIRLEVGLLRAFRRLLPECRHDPAWESFVWQSDLLSSRHIRGAALDPLRRRKHLDEFARLPLDLRSDAIALLEAWHGEPFPMLCATSVISLPSEAFTDLDCGTIQRAKQAILAFAETNRNTYYSESARIWAAALVAEIPGDVLADDQWTEAFNIIFTDSRPKLSTAIAPHSIGANAHDLSVRNRVVAISCDANTLTIEPHARFSSETSTCTLRTARGVVVVRRPAHIPCPWRDDTPRSWASRWGIDGHGYWAEIRVGNAKQRLRWIPPGTFYMGSREDEVGRWPDEGSVRETRISDGFWIFDTPCTQHFWESVLRDGPNPSKFLGANRPVDSVSLQDITRFLSTLRILVPELPFRLPTEAEWEYSCRAGTATSRYGDVDVVAWHSNNSSETTHNVKEMYPNRWGLYDMLGNVFEWCADVTRHDSSKHDADAPEVPSGMQCARGGSWSVGDRYARAACRYWFHPNTRSINIGFRPVSNGSPPVLTRAHPFFQMAGGDRRHEATWSSQPHHVLVKDKTLIPIENADSILLESKYEHTWLVRRPAPSWAREIGNDRFGLWVCISLHRVLFVMRWIPPGQALLRGSAPSDSTSDSNDKEARNPAGFWLSETVCTNAMWNAVMEGPNAASHINSRSPKLDAPPQEIRTFLTMARRAIDCSEVTLPTISQWRYACHMHAVAGSMSTEKDQVAPTQPSHDSRLQLLTEADRAQSANTNINAYLVVNEDISELCISEDSSECSAPHPNFVGRPILVPSGARSRQSGLPPAPQDSALQTLAQPFGFRLLISDIIDVDTHCHFDPGVKGR